MSESPVEKLTRGTRFQELVSELRYHVDDRVLLLADSRDAEKWTRKFNSLLGQVFMQGRVTQIDKEVSAAVAQHWQDLDYLLAHFWDEVLGEPKREHWRLPELRKACERLQSR